MKKFLTLFMFNGIFLLLMSCGSMSTPSMTDSDVVRMPVDAPDKFEAATAFDGTSCVSPLVDPRDGTEITFVRSTSGMADYEVPNGKYGVRKNELLRANCTNGEVVGIVKR